MTVLPLAKFINLRVRLPEWERELDRLAKKVERARQITKKKDKATSLADDSARLVFLCTDISSNAWESRYRIVESIICSKSGRTTREIYDSLAFYMDINENTVRSHLNVLRMNGVIQKNSRNSWSISSEKLTSIKKMLSIQ